MKLLRMSIYALCLSTMLGISTMAMENRKQDVSTGRQVQAVIDKEKKIDEKRLEKIINDEISQGKSEEYSKFYADLIVKGKLDEAVARERAKIFETQVKYGRSFIFAQYYSMLVLVHKLDVERAMFQAEVFERKFKINKDFKRADYYASSIVLYNYQKIKLDKVKALKTMLLEKARNIGKFEMCKKCFKCIDREFKHGRIYYHIIAYIDCLLEGASNEKASEIATIVEEEVRLGRNYDSAIKYARLITDDMFDNPSKIIESKELGVMVKLVELE